jgi:hypothetical protein
MGCVVNPVSGGGGTPSNPFTLTNSPRSVTYSGADIVFNGVFGQNAQATGGGFNAYILGAQSGLLSSGGLSINNYTDSTNSVLTSTSLGFVDGTYSASYEYGGLTINDSATSKSVTLIDGILRIADPTYNANLSSSALSLQAGAGPILQYTGQFSTPPAGAPGSVGSIVVLVGSSQLKLAVYL